MDHPRHHPNPEGPYSVRPPVPQETDSSSYSSSLCRLTRLSPSVSTVPRPSVGSTYLINNIPRGTTNVQLFNSVVAPPHWARADNAPRMELQPHVQFSCVISESRLDDELSVAILEFTDTPAWLRQANLDPYGFPKKTALGTIWRGVNMIERDAQGQTEFMRAAVDDNLIYAETLAEFGDTDVNVQDKVGRTALHWACVKSLPAVVMLCFSVPGCNVGLRDHEDLTAFHIARQKDDEVIPSLFYKSILELEETDPQASLLQVLTVSSEPTAAIMPIFPGEAMFQPVRERNPALVAALIARGVDLTARNEDGDSALHVAAAQTGTADIARALLTAGSDIDAIGSRGATPLHRAARTADEQMVEVLLQWKPDVAIEDNDKRTALHVAAQDGRQDVARLLLAHGTDAKTKDNAGITPQQVARDGGVEFLEMVEEFNRSYGNDIETEDSSGLSTLCLAVKNGDLAVVLALLGNGADLEAVSPLKAMTALQIATQAGLTAIFMALLGAGANIGAANRQGQTSLHLAAIKGYAEMVVTLLDKGANVEEVDRQGRTALRMAVLTGHTDIVCSLLDKGANVRAVDNRAFTALHEAANKGHTKMVIALLGKGANIHPVNKWGQTALHLAADGGHSKTIIALIDRGANVGAVDNLGHSVLHVACGGGVDANCVRTLIDRGANIEALDRWRRTVLHRAADRGYTVVVGVLLDAGANIEAASRVGTPLQLALSAGHTATADLLIARGAKSRKA